MKLGVFAISSIASITSIAIGCTDFGDVPRDVCGNGLLEAGEDCDSDDATCVRCAVTCSVAGDCPNADYTCGVDGVCHAPGGVLAEPTAPVAMQADDLRITDIDRDGTGDVLGVSQTSIIVRRGDAAGSLTAVDSFVTPAQSGPPTFGDLDGDGSIDVSLATLDGIVSFTSRFKTLSPVAIESPLFGDNGEPLNLRYLFTVGQFQLGAFIEDAQNGAVFLLVIDLLNDDASAATPPCVSRLGAIPAANLALETIDVYRVSPEDALNANFVISFLTTNGQVCATSINGGAGAITFADITPAGAGPLVKKPIFADLDNDADTCPSLINSDGGAAALRHWNGTAAGGHCTLANAGSTGALLPPVTEAPPDAVVLGRAPIDPPITIPVPPFPQLGPDALVLTSGLYANVPSLGGIAEIYSSSSRRLAHVAFGDIDNDNDTDIVLATDEDDLDVLYRFPLGLQLFRVDTASDVTSLTLGDYDGNGLLDIAYTETETDHQNMRISYGTTDRPLEPVQVASFSGVSSVTKLQFPDSVDTLGIADDLAIISVDGGGAPTMSFVHGSPQRTMLSFFDPREDKDQDGVQGTPDNPQRHTILRSAVIGEFDGAAEHPDLVLVATPVQGSTLGMRAWLAPGTAKGLDTTPSKGIAANGLANCDGLGVCVANAEYLAWRGPGERDLIVAIDRTSPSHAAVIDPGANAAGFAKTDIPMLVKDLPAAAVVRALYAADLDGDDAAELVATFAAAGDVTGDVRVCKMSAAGVPESCDDLTALVTQVDGDVTACIDAAPGRVRSRGPAIGRSATPGLDLVVLCRAGEATSLFRVSHETGAFVATPLARATGLRAVRVDDVTGDGVDDVVAVQGSGGSQSVVVFAQCGSRELETCQKTAAGESR